MQAILEKTKNGDKITIKVNDSTFIMITNTDEDYVMCMVVDGDIVGIKIISKATPEK